jgi:hypothetical protein
MKGVCIGRLKLLPYSKTNGIDPERLPSRQADSVMELQRQVPRVASLHHGTLRLIWMLHSDGCWLHLELVPRRSSLFDPLTTVASRPASLADEARLIEQDIRNSPLRAALAASGLQKWARNQTPIPLDPLHEMAFRLSRKQWTFEADSGQVCLEFPRVPRYLVDDHPSVVHGIVHAVFARALVLRHIRVEPWDSSIPAVELLGQLRIAPNGNEASRKHGTPWPPTLQVWPGKAISLSAILHRCLISRRVIGAVANDPMELRVGGPSLSDLQE